MNNKQILDSVYKDFFGDIKEEVEIKKEDNNTFNIDDLFIDDESKMIMKKILKYMEDYHNGLEKNYLTFNILIESDDKNTLDNIVNYIYDSAIKYSYIDKGRSDVSLYNLDIDEISNIYKNNGLISIKDLEAINLKDVVNQKKFYHNLLEEVNGKKITLISGKKDDLDKFLYEDKKLEDIFSFRIIYQRPNINDVYNVLLDKIKELSLDESFYVKVLDYITNTYLEYDDSVTDYIDKLYKYILFNKDVPQIQIKKSNEEIFKELNDLVGLKSVKETLYNLVDLITLKNKTKDDLKISDVNLHMVFLGNPGTGKTTVARLIANILYNLGYIKQNKLLEVSSKDLVAEYVGQTAVKTSNVINKAMGGILFIDEAYALSVKNNENSYNAECIATLIKAMEDYRDNLVVIFAGYTKEMQDFLDSNSGIVSRIGYTLEFADYTNEELIDIFKLFVKKAGFVLEDDALSVVDKLINENRRVKNFGNARFIRNLYEKTVINHAKNTKDKKRKTILKTITSEDITL